MSIQKKLNLIRDVLMVNSETFLVDKNKKNNPYYERINLLELGYIDILGNILDELLGYDIDTEEDLDMIRKEVINSMIPVYNSDKIEWLRNEPNSFFFCDETISRFDLRDISSVLAGGMFIQIDEVYTALQEIVSQELVSKSND